MPITLKMKFPPAANSTSTPAATQQASRAMCSRSGGVLSGVMAMNAGITAIGSVITKIEVTVSEAYSPKVMPEITPPHQNAPAILASLHGLESGFETVFPTVFIRVNPWLTFPSLLPRRNRIKQTLQAVQRRVILRAQRLLQIINRVRDAS